MSSRTAIDTRTSILDAARALFESQGYFSVGLEKVAKKAGVSRQAIYLHFSSKADLVQALHDRIYEQDVEPANRRIWEAQTALGALDAWVDAGGEAIPKIWAIAKALDAPRLVDAEAEATWKAPAEGRYGDCLRLARWLKSEGQLASGLRIADAADALWMLTSFGSYESLVIDRGWPLPRWKRWVRQMLGHALLA